MNTKFGIKIFSDGAELQTLLAMNENPLISGMTTNPSLMKKAGITNYREFCLTALKSIQKKPLSFEVFADDLATMESQASEIKTWGTNVYVKIPVLNSEGVSTAPLIKKLTQKGVQLNITAITTVSQVIEVAGALEGGAPSFVSIFCGRLGDAGHDPRRFAQTSVDICKAHKKGRPETLEVLWASTREVYNLFEARDTGCEIITMPPDLIQKLSNVGKTPLEISLDTVKTFKLDSEKAAFKL